MISVSSKYFAALSELNSPKSVCIDAVLTMDKSQKILESGQSFRSLLEKPYPDMTGCLTNKENKIPKASKSGVSYVLPPPPTSACKRNPGCIERFRGSRWRCRIIWILRKPHKGGVFRPLKAKCPFP